MAMLETARLGRLNMICDVIALDVPDVLDDYRMSACLDYFGDAIYLPMAGRPGWVDCPPELEPYQTGWFDAFRWALSMSGGMSSPLFRRMPRCIYAGLGGFAGCSLRGFRGDDDDKH